MISASMHNPRTVAFHCGLDTGNAWITLTSEHGDSVTIHIPKDRTSHTLADHEFANRRWVDELVLQLRTSAYAPGDVRAIVPIPINADDDPGDR